MTDKPQIDLSQVPDRDIRAEYIRRIPRAPKKLRPCVDCGRELSARERRKPCPQCGCRPCKQTKPQPAQAA